MLASTSFVYKKLHFKTCHCYRNLEHLHAQCVSVLFCWGLHSVCNWIAVTLWNDWSFAAIAVSDGMCFYIWESSGERYSKNSTWISHHFCGIRRIYSHWRSVGYKDKTDAIHWFIVTKWHSTATQIWVCICSGDGLLSIQAIISNQCCLIPSEVLWHSPVGNFTCNAPNIITSYVWKSLS